MRHTTSCEVCQHFFVPGGNRRSSLPAAVAVREKSSNVVSCGVHPEACGVSAPAHDPCGHVVRYPPCYVIMIHSNNRRASSATTHSAPAASLHAPLAFVLLLCRLLERRQPTSATFHLFLHALQKALRVAQRRLRPRASPAASYCRAMEIGRSSAGTRRGARQSTSARREDHCRGYKAHLWRLSELRRAYALPAVPRVTQA